MVAGNVGNFRASGERCESLRCSMLIDQHMDVEFECGDAGRGELGRDSKSKAGEDDNQKADGKQPGPGRWGVAKK